MREEKGKKMLSHSQILLLLKVFAMAMDSRESEGRFRFRNQSLETPSVFRPKRGPCIGGMKADDLFVLV